MGYIATSKFGNCSRCPSKNTNCKKRGKYLVCILCCNKEDGEKQISKSNQRQALQREKSKIRSLISNDSNVEMVGRNQVIEDLDWTVSRIVRMKGADKNGIQTCYTCGFKALWSDLQCSHYIGRTAVATRFDTKHNCKPGCFDCNITKHGNLEVFAENLERDTPGITEHLYQLSKEVTHIGTDELKQMLAGLREELKLIENSRKVNTDI